MEYLKTLATTFEGKHEKLIRRIFRRGAILVKLEILEGSSKKNIRFIKGQLEELSNLNEVQYLSNH
jgi:hypothetical protein